MSSDEPLQVGAKGRGRKRAAPSKAPARKPPKRVNPRKRTAEKLAEAYEESTKGTEGEGLIVPATPSDVPPPTSEKPPTPAPPPNLTPLTEEQFERHRYSMSFWLAGYANWVAQGQCIIKDKDGKYGPLQLNNVQMELLGEAMVQATERDEEWEAGRPIRLIILKARKHGVSTFCATLLYYLSLRIDHFSSLMVAHSDPGRNAIFSISTRAHEAIHRQGRLPSKMIRWVGRDSFLASHTAAGKFVGTADTVQALHVSELAKCQSDAGMDKDAIVSMINAVPQMNPFSMVFIESTAQGPVGEFYERCMAAQRGDSDYRLCFFPWFADPLYRKIPKRGWKPDDYGRWLLDTFSLTEEQVAWYDWMLHTEHGGDRALMRWEYPSTVEEAFEAPSGRVYRAFTREKNVRRYGLEGATLYRGIDWGDTEEHPTFVTWIAHWANRSPKFTVDPDCEELLKELQLYSWNKRTGQPIPEHDHGLDSARYIVTSARLTGHVHIYREWRTTDGARLGYDGIAREIHARSGWAAPDHVDERDLGMYQPLVASAREEYEATVADRSRPGAIQAMVRYGIPCIGYKNPTGRSGKGPLGKGPIRDGISWVTALIRGDASWESLDATEEEKAYSGVEKLRQEWGGRPVLLPRKMAKVLKRENERESLMARLSDGDDLDD